MSWDGQLPNLAGGFCLPERVQPHDYGDIRSVNLTAARSILVAVALLPPGMADAATCQELEQSTAPRQIHYLQQNRSGLRTECVQFAIARLGQPAYLPAADVLVSAADVLVSYLDFRVAKPIPYVVDHIEWMEEFPAAHALFEIGLPATGSLVRAIGSIKSSELLATNAEKVLLIIYRGDQAGAVLALRQSSRSAPDAVTASRLFESAIRLSRKCIPDPRLACEAALK
jgi:hypothetical protein